MPPALRRQRSLHRSPTTNRSGGLGQASYICCVGKRPSNRGDTTLSRLPWLLLRLGRARHGRAAGVLSIWLLWEGFLERRWRLRDARPDGAVRYRITAHRGRPVTLSDGTRVQPGDRIVELHFRNHDLLRTTGTAGWNPWQTLDAIDKDLAALSELVAPGEIGPVRALHGVTLFASPGRRLGFDVQEVPHTWTWALQRFFLVGLLPIYHRDGWREFDRMRRRWPGELWMSIDALNGRARLDRPAAS